MCTSPKKSFRAAYTSGFTLIELLTVIAIVGILSAIALPVVSKATSTAKQLKKMAVFRQYGIAHSLYVNDNKGNVVFVKIPQDTFKTLLLPYFNFPQNQKVDFFKPVDLSHPTYEGYDPEKPWNNGFGMNNKIALPDDTGKNNQPDHPYKLTNITYPECRVLFGDSVVTEMQIDPLNLDACLVTSRHAGGRKGMFILFNNSVVLYTRNKAVAALQKPAMVATIPE
jgi:prepilin-type N-terminal cleavage/methylation domain-containing protein